MVAELGERAEAIRRRMVEPKEDNMLKVTSDGRKLALDQRLADPTLPDDPESKVNVCVQNVYQVWQDTAEQNGAQLIFSDLSTPKGDGSFNVYEDIKQKLMEKGVPPEEIAFIHKCKNRKPESGTFRKGTQGSGARCWVLRQKWALARMCRHALRHSTISTARGGRLTSSSARDASCGAEIRSKSQAVQVCHRGHL